MSDRSRVLATLSAELADKAALVRELQIEPHDGSAILAMGHQVIALCDWVASMQASEVIALPWEARGPIVAYRHALERAADSALVGYLADHPEVLS